MKNTGRPKTRSSSFQVRDLLAQSVRVLRHPGLDFLCLPASELSAGLVVITPRAVGTAPARNKIRRRLKSIFRRNQERYGAFVWFVFVRPPSAALTFAQLEQLFATAHEAAVRHFQREPQSA